MRIGILTFHRGLNHGGFLQTYCLQEELSEMGHEVVIINYQNASHRWREFIKPWFVMRNPRTIINYVTKLRAFRHDWKVLNQSRFTTSRSRVNQMQFDIVVVGSDVVWDLSLFGGDELYFGNIGCAPKVITYAASCGSLPPDYELPQWACDGLSKFSSVLVRDAATIELVNNNIGFIPERVVDPCLLHDLSLLERNNTNGTASIPSKPYLLVYAYELNQDQIERVRKIATEMGLITVAVGYHQKWCDVNIMHMGPLDVLTICRHATCMVAGTFHGTIFALSFDLPFVVHTPPAALAKVSDLLSLLSLSERLDFNKIENLLKSSPQVRDSLHELRQHSRELLKKGLTG